MPRVIDKILINDRSVKGMNAAIEAEFESAKMLADEIKEGGWVDETDALRAEMATACDLYHKAQLKYHAFMRQFNGKLAEFIDDHRPTP